MCSTLLVVDGRFGFVAKHWVNRAMSSSTRKVCSSVNVSPTFTGRELQVFEFLAVMCKNYPIEFVALIGSNGHSSVSTDSRHPIIVPGGRRIGVLPQLVIVV